MSEERLTVKFIDIENIKRQDLDGLSCLLREDFERADEYKAAVGRVIDSGWFLQGEEIRRFEADYARYVGTEHCVTVASVSIAAASCRSASFTRADAATCSRT